MMKKLIADDSFTVEAAHHGCVEAQYESGRAGGHGKPQ